MILAERAERRENRNLSLILMNERSHNLRVVERAEIGIVMVEIIDLSFLITLCRFSHIKYVFATRQTTLSNLYYQCHGFDTG